MSGGNNKSLAAMLHIDVRWQEAYAAVEKEVKKALEDYEGDGLTSTKLMEAVGLRTAPAKVKTRFFSALRALSKRGLRDWFDVIEIHSPYKGSVKVKMHLYLPPSIELQIARLTAEINTLSDLQAGLQITLDKLRAGQ